MNFASTDRIACVDHTLVTALQRGDDVDAHTAAVRLRRFIDGDAKCRDSLHVFADLLQSRGDVRGEWLARRLAWSRPMDWVRAAAGYADTWYVPRSSHFTWHVTRDWNLDSREPAQRRARVELVEPKEWRPLTPGPWMLEMSADLWHVHSYSTWSAGEDYVRVTIELIALNLVEYVDTPVAVRPPNP